MAKRLFWIKLWTEEWLDGSIRLQLTSSERGILADLFCMAGRSRSKGIIQSGRDAPYSHEYLANRLNVPLKELETTLKHLIAQERIIEDSTGIMILNWHKYQDSKKEQAD